MAVTWLWCGAVTDTGFTVSAKVGAGVSVRLAVQAGDLSSLTAPTYGTAVTSDSDGYVKVTATGLAANTAYTYGLELGGTLDPTLGHATTFQTPGVAGSFKFAHASCMGTGTNHRVFDSIKAKDPAFFVQLGDLHYENYNGTDPAVRRGHYDNMLTASRVKGLWERLPVPYVWDDHDFCGNNSIGTASGKTIAQQVFRQVIPHHPLDDAAAVYQTYMVGRVAFVMTDLRSERSSNSAADTSSKSMMGATQKAWFKQALLDADAAGAALIVWVSSSVYSGHGTSGINFDNDQWAAFTTERTELANFIRDNGLTDKLLVVSGDAHMVAHDDGTNTDFASGGGAGFQEFVGSALDRSAIQRGDHWSSGAFPGTGQYGLFDFTDDGTTLSYTWTAYRVDATTGADTTLLTITGEYPPPASPPPPGPVGAYHDEVLTRAGADIAVTGDTVPLLVDLAELSPEWWQNVTVSREFNAVSNVVGTTSGSNSGTSSNYSGATQDVYFRDGISVAALTFYAVFADTYTLKVDGAVVDTVVAAAGTEATFDVGMDFAEGSTHEFSITATATSSRQWRYVSGGDNYAGLGIVQRDWQEAAAYYLPWKWDATVDRGWDTANIEVLDGGVAVPYDLVSIDTVALTGKMFVKCALTAGVDKTLTVRADPSVSGPLAADPLGRHAVWAGYKAFVTSRPMNRADDTWLSQYGMVTRVGDLLDFPGSGNGYLYLDGLTKPTSWTMGASAVLDSTSGGFIVSVGTTGSTSNSYVACIGFDASKYSLWNSSETHLYGAAAGVGVRKRLNATELGTTERTLFVGGVESATDVGTVQRPGLNGDRWYVGTGVVSSSNSTDGRIEFAYLRHDVLADDWLAVENASWESPATFWTIAPPPTGGSLDATFPPLDVAMDGEYAGSVPDLNVTLPAFRFTGSANVDQAGALDATFPPLEVEAVGSLPDVLAGDLLASFPKFRTSFVAEQEDAIGTVTAYDLNGRVRAGIAYVSTDVAVEPVPAGLSPATKVDKALAYPTPDLVDGRPT